MQIQKDFLASLLNALSNQIAVIDSQGSIIYVNQAWINFGINNGMAVDFNWFGVNYLNVCEHDGANDLDEKICATTRGILDVVLGNQVSYQAEYPCDSPERRRWFLLKINVLTGLSEKLFVISHTDITLRKEAEIALLEQKNQIQQIVDNHNTATFMIDTNYQVTHWNHRCEELTGVKATEILHQPAWRGFYRKERPTLSDLVLSDRPEQASDLYVTSLPSHLTDKGWHAEGWLEELKHGHRRYVSAEASKIIDTDGNTVGVIQTIIDMTQNKYADIALRNERQQLASVIEGTRAGTWQWNVATGEAEFNEYWTGILGYTLEELDSISGSRVEIWASLVHPDDANIIHLALQAHFNKQTEHYEAEFRMRHKHGHWVWILARGRVLTWLKDSEPEWMYGTHLDITVLKVQQEALVLANERIAFATQSGGIGIWSYDIINDRLECDSTVNALYGFTQDERLTVSRWDAMLHPEDRNDIVLAFEEAIAGDRDYDVEFRTIWQDGSVHYLRAKASITRDNQGKALQMLGTKWDVTPLRELSIEVANQHETLRVTLKSIGDAVITTDPKGRITWLNPVAENMTGWLTSEAKNKPLAQVFNIISEVTRKAANNPVKECLKHGKVAGLANHTILISRDGIEYGIEDSASPIRTEDGVIIGAVLVFHDVSEQRRLSNEMSYRAMHDPLTGLLNRGEFEVRLTRVLNLAKAETTSHALMFIDLDLFKLVNDACGHTAGDMLLKQVSKILSEIVRSRDAIARVGGDEFAVILEHCTTEQAQRVAQTICDSMDEYRFIHDSKRFRIGASIGLAVLDGRWVNVAHAIQAADAACYIAKEAGRNRVHTWFDTDASMRLHQGEMQWATRLEIAMDENQFELYAQRINPVDKLDLSEADPRIHAEILLRLRGPHGEMIAPGLFFPAAERFHLASRIDRWVLSNVIAWLESLSDMSVVSTLCVNLSGQSIGDRAFHAHALTQLKTAGKNVCERICLEITETAMITNMVDASIFIEQVRQLGVRVALDDFGAGASSFGYLKTLNIDVLKIDGQFITGMIQDPLDDSAVRCFVDVARIAGLKTVAEYVETSEILSHVRSLGIDYAQGYLIDEPAPINSLLNSFVTTVV